VEDRGGRSFKLIGVCYLVVAVVVVVVVVVVGSRGPKNGWMTDLFGRDSTGLQLDAS